MMPAKSDESYLIKIEHLQTYFRTMDGIVQAVNDVSFTIKPGQTVGLVGESGSGKSVTAYSILRLLPKIGYIAGGEILFDRGNGSGPIDMTTLDPEEELIRSIRGNEIAMIFQEPMTSFSPVHTIGDQIAEVVELHQAVSKAEAKERAIEMMAQVGIADPHERFDQYPQHFSGGMRQRAMIAMALACNPSLLIADEPTTALDVTIQAQILELMQSLQKKYNMAILIITHNLGVVAEMAERVEIMYMGRIVESGTVDHIFKRPLHPYTVGLLRSIPKLEEIEKTRLTPIPGSIPSPFDLPPGCSFYPRCPAEKSAACQGDIQLLEVEPGHSVRCTLY
jgi:oligopeptide/dipeptide ABC transporter ATP-binding protein